MPTASFAIWRDTGYTEGCFERPSASDTLPTPDFTFENVHTSRQELFSTVRLPVAYEDVYDCSYIRVSYDFNNGEDVTVYGWVDSVRCSSDTIGSPMTVVEWHPDLWRTYLPRASFGSGMVVRRPVSADMPPQEYPYRYVMPGHTEALIPSSDMLFAIMNYTEMKDGVSSTSTLCWPVSVRYPDSRWYVDSEKTITAPSFKETVEARLDEFLGLDPTAVYALFMSPLPPNTVTSSGNIGIGYATMNGWMHKTLLAPDSGSKHGGWTPSWYILNTEPYAEKSVYVDVATDDTRSYVLTDLQGGIAGTLPWGFHITEIRLRIVNSDNSAYISARCVPEDSPAVDSPAIGCEFNIPLPTLAMAENAKSSYLYSGQQEFDRSQLQIQREQALMSGLVNMGTGGIQGAMAGATNRAQQVSINEGFSMGVSQSIRTAAVPGAVAGAAASAVGAIGDYFITGYTNDRMMDITMTQKANQTAQLTLPSSGSDWLMHGRSISLMRLDQDEYSVRQRTYDLSLYGAHVQEPRQSCQTLIAAGGPLRIVNLTVTGDIPVQAKTYIRQAFSDGVRIV